MGLSSELSNKIASALLSLLIVGWLVISCFPPNIEEVGITIFGIERPVDYFVYDLVHKTGVLLGFASALIPNKGRALTALIIALIADSIYEVADLIITNDTPNGAGLFVQNGIIIFAFIAGYIKFAYDAND